MDAIFQQAPFDDKNDDKLIEGIYKEVEQRARRTPGYRFDTCNRCGQRRNGISRIVDMQFVCVRCLFKDEVERKFKIEKYFAKTKERHG